MRYFAAIAIGTHSSGERGIMGLLGYDDIAALRIGNFG
jgi:hypothetical protein